MNSTFTLFVAWLVQNISEFVDSGGDREAQMQLRWPSVEQLSQLDIYEVAWTLPEDQYMEKKDYVGDWRTNGKGDIGGFKGPGGKELIKLNLPKEWKKRAHHQTVMERKIEADDLGDLIR